MFLIDTLCPTCYKEDTPLIRFKKQPSLIACPRCFSAKRGKWYYPPPPPSDEHAVSLQTQFVRDYIIKTVKVGLDIPASDELITIEPTLLLDPPPKEVDITISLKRYNTLSDSRVETTQITLPLEYQLCPRCSRIAKGYYEAIFQIRGAQRTLSPKERETILDTIGHILQTRFRERPLSFISKVVQKNQGIDLYFSSSKCATAVAYSLRDSAAASIKITSKLIGVDRSTSKRRYRVYISVRMPPLRVGDIYALNNTLYEIHAIGGGKVTLRNLETGAHRSILVNTLWSQFSHRQVEIFPRDEYVHTYLVIAVTSDSLQLMNLKTYETYEVQKMVGKSLTSGDVIQGFKWKHGKIFLLDTKNP